MPTKPIRRADRHTDTLEQIKSIAWEQIAASGASGLSLGAVARKLRLTTPALYRYFASRNDLLAALASDAYASFAAALETARDGLSPEDPAGRFRAMCLGYYAWAVHHSSQYLLLFGTPVPGYEMDAKVGQAADRSFLVLLDVIDAADRAGRIGGFPREGSLPRELKAQLEAVRHSGKAYSARVTYLALVSWSFIHGLTSLELSGRYALMLADRSAELVRLEVDRFMQAIGLE